jgi:hypothetical protein
MNGTHLCCLSILNGRRVRCRGRAPDVQLVLKAHMPPSYEAKWNVTNLVQYLGILLVNVRPIGKDGKSVLHHST